MDNQTENAIEVAFNPVSDQTSKSQALEFLGQLRSEPQGWQVCLSLLLRESRPSEIVRHVCLDMINEAIRADRIDNQSLTFIRDNLMEYIRNTYGMNGNAGIPTPDPVNIQNKLTQTTTYLFMALYSTQWASFFHDMLALTTTAGSMTRDNEKGVTFYLRVLNAVHDEIADVLVPRLPQEQRGNNELKDLVRQRDAKMIAQSWQEILSHWKDRNINLVALCLAAVGRWVVWTDISLTVNESFLNILFQLVTPSESADQSGTTLIATETFTEIMGKKTSADDKLELIDVLKIKDVVSQLIESKGLRELRFTTIYDTDLAEAVAKLVNNTVYDIVKILESAPDGALTSIRGKAQLNIFLPLVLRFFSDEYDEICSTVIPCLTDLLALFRKKAKANSIFCLENAGMLPPILDAVIMKGKYDDDSAWDNDDSQTDEAEFQELRKRLQVLQQAVATVNEILYIETVSNLVNGTIEKFRSQDGHIDWRDIDLAFYEIFLLGEVGLKNGGLYSKAKPASAAAERLIDMMFKLINSNIASFPHPAIQLMFIEICVRYYTFFEINPQFIGPVLEKFVQLVHHEHVKVQSRSWYLFFRFVKQLRPHIGDIGQTVIQALGDLLRIEVQVSAPATDDDDDSSDGQDAQTDTRFTRQLYLYEAIGSICSAQAVPVDNQALYLRSIITPLYLDFEKLLPTVQIDDEHATLYVHHLIMAFGTIAKGFSNWSPGAVTAAPVALTPEKVVSDEFMKMAEATLVALERLTSVFEIRAAARFTFSRLIGVLDNSVLPQLTRWIDGFLCQTSTKEEMAAILRLLDQIIHIFKLEIFDILNTLLTPFLQKVFLALGQIAEGTDDILHRAELKRAYLGFLLVILNNNLGGVLISEVNQNAFNDVITMNKDLAKDMTDVQTAKTTFLVLIRMVNTWGGPDVQAQPVESQGNSLAPPATNPQLPGFDQFIMTDFSPICWALATHPNFHSQDAQTKQVLGEAAGLQKAIYAKTGDKYLAWLRDYELSGMGMDNVSIEEYLRVLSTSDLKGFRHFFQNLVQKSSQRQ